MRDVCARAVSACRTGRRAKLRGVCGRLLLVRLAADFLPGLCGRHFPEHDRCDEVPELSEQQHERRAEHEHRGVRLFARLRLPGGGAAPPVRAVPRRLFQKQHQQQRMLAVRARQDELRSQPFGGRVCVLHVAPIHRGHARGPDVRGLRRELRSAAGGSRGPELSVRPWIYRCERTVCAVPRRRLQGRARQRRVHPVRARLRGCRRESAPRASGVRGSSRAGPGPATLRARVCAVSARRLRARADLRVVPALLLCAGLRGVERQLV